MFMLLRLTVLASLILVATGCSSLTAALLDAKEKVEVLVGEQGAGTYTITLDKDGTVLLKEQRRCDKGPDGKLSGCHKL